MKYSVESVQRAAVGCEIQKVDHHEQLSLNIGSESTQKGRATRLLFQEDFWRPILVRTE